MHSTATNVDQGPAATKDTLLTTQIPFRVYLIPASVPDRFHRDDFPSSYPLPFFFLSFFYFPFSKTPESLEKQGQKSISMICLSIQQHLNDVKRNLLLHFFSPKRLDNSDISSHRYRGFRQNAMRLPFIPVISGSQAYNFRKNNELRRSGIVVARQLAYFSKNCRDLSGGHTAVRTR